MERILYLFATMHTNKEIRNMTEEEDRLAREQWKWIERQLMDLPHANRAYFDTLDDSLYPGRLTLIQAEIEGRVPPDVADMLPPEFWVQVELTRQGTIIECTESSQLMDYHKDRFGPFAENRATLETSTRKDKEDFDKSIDRRDHFIAERIHNTLGPGETGFLFQGAIHRIQDFLEVDIKLVIYLGNLRPRRRQ